MPLDGPTRATHAYDRSWAGRPAIARALRILAYLLPTLTSFAATFYISRNHPPHELGIPSWQWWILVLAIGVIVLLVTEKASRRLLPLAALFKISLVFPDEAPSRYRVAMRTGTTRQMQRRIEELKAQGIEDDETRHAETMLEMIAALSVHDRMTRGHCERVRAYTDMIIEEIGMPEEDANKLRWAALLHDVGKLFVPYEILNKDGRPTDQEWELLKAHTWKGDELIGPLKPFLGEWAAAIGSHHERWDGGGYPNGLAGADIHLGARIVAVADTFDVMTSTRSYKKPIPAEDARAEIARCAGTQFDPKVARAFLNIGIGRLRFALGPMSWAANLPAAAQTPIATPVIASATAVVTTGIGILSGVILPEPDPAPAEVAFVADAPEEPATLAPPSVVPRPTTTTPPTTAPPTTPAPTTVPPTTTPPTTARPTTTVAPATTTTFTPTTAAPTTTQLPAAPSAGVAPVSGLEDTPFSFVLTGQAATDQPIFTITNQPDFGTVGLVSLATPGDVLAQTASLQEHRIGATYMPEPNRYGTTTFSYRICEPASPFRCDVGTVELTIDGVNDPPSIPTLTATTTEDATLRITAQSIIEQIVDVDGDPLAVGFGTPSVGSLLGVGEDVDFTPPADWSGTATIPVTICEPSACYERVISVTVTSENDAPIASTFTVNRDEDALVFITAADMFAAVSDAETPDDALTFTFSHSGTGTLTPSATSFVFQPQAQSVVTQYVDYIVCDQGPTPLCAANKVKLTFTPVDDPPFAADDTIVADEDTDVTVGLTELHALVTDVDTADADLTFTFAYSGDGTLDDGPTGFTFTPQLNAVTDQTVSYEACDDSSPTPLCDSGAFTLRFTPVNDAPALAAVLDIDAATGIAIGPVTLSAIDVDGDDVTFSSPDLPLGLALTSEGQLSGSPDESLRGQTLTVTIVATDDGAPVKTDTTTFDLDVHEMGLSPFAGTIRINEVSHRGTPFTEFVEIYSSDATIEGDGFVLQDFVPGGTQEANSFIATYLPGPLTNWWVVDLDSSNVIESDGDDLWLIDPDGLIVDYVAWEQASVGQSEKSGAPPAILDMWDDTYEAELSHNSLYLSISLAATSDTDESGCWEHTTAGVVDASRCSALDIRTTIDLPPPFFIDSKGGVNYS